MTHPTAAPDLFRRRLLAREALLGTFIKTPAVQVVEIAATAGLDFVVLDQEHAPLDRVTVDALVLAGQAAGIPVVVRVPGGEARDILPALDCGARGVLVPHVDSAARAQAVVAEARYRGGRRGFTNSSRAGRYGAAGFQEHTVAADTTSAVLAMIEDLAALEVLADIMAVAELDAVFIGRGDLACALGVDGTSAPQVVAAAERIAAAARAAGKTLCAHVDRADSPDVAWLRGLGVTTYVVSSDQGLMRRAAQQAVAEFRRG
jgi:2-keto-3-deoxy-L-rhamnonate aldolase RhmA